MISLWVVSEAGAQPPPTPRRELNATGRVWFEGDSTLHRFEGNANRFQARFELGPVPTGEDHAADWARAGRFTGFELVIPVKQLTTAEAARDRNMWAALKASQFPLITFRMGAHRPLPPAAPGTDFKVAASGKLTVAGVEREVELSLVAQPTEAGLRLTGRVPLKMSEFGIRPPTALLGTIRTRDELQVRFDLLVPP